MEHIEIVTKPVHSESTTNDDAIVLLLQQCRGHIQQDYTVNDLYKNSTKLYHMNGPKLQDTIKTLGGVYWVSKESIFKHVSHKAPQVKDLKPFAECLCLCPSGMPGQFVPTIRAFYAHSNRPEVVGVPRFWGLSMFGHPDKDLRHNGHALACVAQNLHLRPLQIQAVNQTIETVTQWGGATVIADCGFGKTRLAVDLVSKFGRRAMILCNREVLMIQWADVIRTLVPGWTIAWLQGHASVHKRYMSVNAHEYVGPSQPHDVCIASIDTLIEGHLPRDIIETYGTVIVDEAHHLAAASLVHALPMMPVKHVVALSATPDRRDGLEHALYWLAGPASFVYKRLPSITGEQHTVVIKRVDACNCANREKMYANGQLAFSEMLTLLSVDPKRNEYIAKCIHEALTSERRKIIVVSQLVNHCILLRNIIGSVDNVSCALMAGPKPEADKAKDPSTRIIFATYAMMEEGYDDPTLDTLILATPRSRIQQTIGRIERVHEGKLRPVVYDIADMFSVYPAMWYKRQTFYKSRGFKIEQH